jgi:hypothetical protein
MRALFSLERPQEINNLLLLPSVQLMEMFDDLICLAAKALVISDSVYQVATIPPLPGPVFVGVVADHGKQIRAMSTIPGVQVNYVFTVRVHP